MTKDYFAITYGSWEIDSKKWWPNPYLEKSADEQWKHNVEHGLVKEGYTRGDNNED